MHFASYHDTFRMAALMEKNRLAASRIRQRYLRQWLADCITDGSPIALYWAKKALEEINYLRSNDRFEPERRGESRIDEQMIEQARNYPVEKLVEWRHNKSTAWCHLDNNPSLYLLKRVNRLCCPVCDKKFDPIAVLKERDNIDFVSAVRQLC